MLTHMGEPVPILKPFKARFNCEVHTPNQPKDVTIALTLVDEPLVIESTKDDILVNDVPYLTWVDQQQEKITPQQLHKLLRTMVISAVYGEDRYLKQLNKGE